VSTTDETLSNWNRRILTILSCAFVVMSLAVFTDRGATGEAAQLSPDGIEGQQVWRRHNCVLCHQLYGMGGFLGPDLTNVVDRLGEETLAWVLRNGRGSMPNLNLSETEISSLVAFLRDLNPTGKFPPNQWPPQWFPDQNSMLDNPSTQPPQ
jgi:nitric oxide reductase subunit C